MVYKQQKEEHEEKKTHKCPHCGHRVSVKREICPYCRWFLNLTDTPENQWCRGVQVPFSRKTLSVLLFLAVAGRLLIYFGIPYVAELLPLATSWSIVTGFVFRTVGECGLLYGLGYGLRFERRHMSCHILLLILVLAALGCFSLLWTFRDMLPMTISRLHAIYLLGLGLLISLQALYIMLGVRLCYCYHGNLSVLGLAMIIIAIAQVVLNFVFGLLGRSAVWDILVLAAYVFYLFMLRSRLYDSCSYMGEVKEMNASEIERILDGR